MTEDSKLKTYDFKLNLKGGLAQLARAPALHAGGQRFESVILHHTHRFLKGIGYNARYDIRIIMGKVL